MGLFIEMLQPVKTKKWPHDQSQANETPLWGVDALGELLRKRKAFLPGVADSMPS
jgi:hypothetical protein